MGFERARLQSCRKKGSFHAALAAEGYALQTPQAILETASKHSLESNGADHRLNPVRASGRKAAVQAAVKSLKGKVESFHFAFGSDDIVLIVDAPDNIAAVALSMAVGSTGLVSIRTTPLLTAEEVDQALALPSKYRAPGQEI